MKTKKTGKTIKNVIAEAHKEGAKYAKQMADDCNNQGNPAVKAQYDDIVSDQGYPSPSKTDYVLGSYIMGVIAGAIRAITGKENVMVEYPLLNAAICVIPIFGPLISGFDHPQGLKVLLFFFADMFMLFLLPIYPFYMLFKFIDTYTIIKRVKAGKEVREWEWFWN